MIVHSAAKSGFIPGGDLSALIARLEAAEVGSRGLDAAIWAALLPVKVKVSDFWPVYSDERKTCVEFTLPPKRTRTITRSLGEFNHADPVTTSLDAALALAERVLPGFTWRVQQHSSGMFDAAFWADPDDNHVGYGRAPSPALALCIAILKAKAQGGAE